MLYRHRKRGTVYRVIALKATLEWAADKGPHVVYQDAQSGRIWVRSESQFFDGRFERIERCDGNHGGPRCPDPECWNR